MTDDILPFPLMTLIVSIGTKQLSDVLPILLNFQFY